MEAQSARVITFPHQAPVSVKPRLECLVTTSPDRFPQERHAQVAQQCRELVGSFERKHGFTLPGLVFEADSELEPEEWRLSMRGCDLYAGRLSNPDDPMSSISAEIMERPWRFFTFESFRVRLKELEDWEPYLAQEVGVRLDLVSTWQALQALLKNGGSLHRFSAKLERLLIEVDGRSREHFLSPRMLSSLQQA